jgi:hypothetical protein
VVWSAVQTNPGCGALDEYLSKSSQGATILPDRPERGGGSPSKKPK